MKKILKYTLLSMLFLLTIFSIKEVKAETYTGQAIWPSEHISNIFLKKIKPDGYTKYQQGRFLRRSEDNKFVYCLQPYTDIDNNLPYYSVARSDYARVLNFTEAQWDRISLLAYYGYDYTENGYDHSSQKWYVITQVMIWRTTNPESRIVFTDSLNGSINESKFASEIAELESLVSNHYVKPNLESSDLTIPLGQSVTLTDGNSVLKNYKVSSTENATATISGNDLIITSTGIGTAKVNLVKNAKKYSVPPIVYFSDHSQNVFRVGHYDPVSFSITAKVVGGKIEINKLDSATKTPIPQGEATLQNAVYGIYNTNDEKIATITTNETGYAISGYLPSLGEFYIKEETPSNGYTLDINKYYFTIDENNLLATIDVYENVIKRDVDITKVYASAETGIMTQEPNVEFGFYNNKNELYTSATTNKDGRLVVSLPYGSYVVKQLTTTPDHEKMQDFNLLVTEVGDTLRYVISNADTQAKLKVVKIDAESGKAITKAGIKFRIFDIERNEYVSQTITYPTASKISVFETDKNGVLITPYSLSSGDYRLEEVENQIIDGYLWNDKPLLFHIGDDSEFIFDEDYGVIFVAKFENKIVKGQIDIIKIGEEIVYENNTYHYEEIVLDNVKYELYANENIITGDGVTHFNKGDKVATLITGENGKVSLDNLYLGKYCLLEISSSHNNLVDSESHCFELTYKGQYTSVVYETINLKNRLPKGILEFTKTDLVTGDVIPNVKIEIYDESDSLLFTGLTDENGKITITDLQIGKFYIKEIESATGYELTDEIVYFEILEDGEIVKATMTNEQIVVPNTGISDSIVVDIIGFILIAIGIGYIIYDKKRKK